MAEFGCDQCPATFDNARSKASHAKMHNKSVRCPICDQEIRYLVAHVKREHSDDPLVRLEVGLADLVSEVRQLRGENSQFRRPITPVD